MAIDEIKKERLKKLQNIKDAGVNPYPAKAKRDQEIKIAREMEGEMVRVVGRIKSFRTHGKITFSDIEDVTGKIQLFFSQQELAGSNYDLLNNLDIGDFLEVFGEVFKTQAGEISIRVKEFKILTKTLLPLPSSWYGLKDVEERYRKRYLDLVMNSKVRETFEKRSKIIYAIRKFLTEEKGYFEIEHPILQPLYGGTRARPFKTHHNTLDADLYLRISNELYMKRLIVGGFEKVFEIGHTFRNEGMDRNHNPEFTMLETMEAYADYMDNMDLVEEMFEYVANIVFGKTKLSYQGKDIEFKRPWKRVKLIDLFKEKTGVEFSEIDTLEKATELAKKLGVEIKDFMTDGEILLEIFEKKCTTELIQPTFIYDYPADFYPLAKNKAGDPKFVESFDIYVAGMEMGTNYSEQNDPQALREAWVKERDKELAGNPEAQILDEDFLEALEYGMPPTSGIGPGVDRWVMVMTDSASISDVIAFPTMKPLKGESKDEVSATNHELSPTQTGLSDETQKARELSQKEEKQTLSNDFSSQAGKPGITRDQAFKLITDLLKNKNLIKHSLAVEAIMRDLADYLKNKNSDLPTEEFDKDEWGLVGLLHDADYEITGRDLLRHTLVTEENIKPLGASDRLIEAIKAHHDGIRKTRDNYLEKSIYAVDELSGLITATALVKPDKKLASVTVETVLKKFPEKSFAAGARRDMILTCEEELGIPLEEFVKIALKAMQGISDKLGL